MSPEPGIIGGKESPDVLKGDWNAIIAGAGKMLAGPKAHMDLAKKYVDGPCNLHAMAFGVVGAAVISGTYNTSRQLVSDNAGEASKLLQNGADGLVKIAHAIKGADQASAPKQMPNEAGSYSEPSGSLSGLHNLESNAAEVMWAADIGATVGVLLLPMNLGILLCLGMASTVAPTAIISTTSWLLFRPDDQALSKAINGWGSAKSQFDLVKVDDVANSSGGYAGIGADAWSGSSRTNYDAWCKRVQPQLDKLGAAAGTNQGTLQALLVELEVIQIGMFAVAMVSLLLILLYQACAAFPVVGVIFETLVQIQGAILSATTTSVVAGITTALLTFFGAIGTIVGTAQFGFASLQPASGGNLGEFGHVQID
ncbi:MAG: hypothetical protein ACJ72W_20505, partial [Actinoallomurus sp.]